VLAWDKVSAEFCQPEGGAPDHNLVARLDLRFVLDNAYGSINQIQPCEGLSIAPRRLRFD